MSYQRGSDREAGLARADDDGPAPGEPVDVAGHERGRRAASEVREITIFAAEGSDRVGLFTNTPYRATKGHAFGPGEIRPGIRRGQMRLTESSVREGGREDANEAIGGDEGGRGDTSMGDGR